MQVHCTLHPKANKQGVKIMQTNQAKPTFTVRGIKYAQDPRKEPTPIDLALNAAIDTALPLGLLIAVLAIALLATGAL